MAETVRVEVKEKVAVDDAEGVELGVALRVLLGVALRVELGDRDGVSDFVAKGVGEKLNVKVFVAENDGYGVAE